MIKPTRGGRRKARAYVAKQKGKKGGVSIPIDISKIKDKSLQGIENRIRKLQHEEAFIFDGDGNLVDGVSGGKGSVGIPDKWERIDGATVTHGHPTGIFGYGGTLSFEDVGTFAGTNWAEIRAAANGQGEYNYILRRTNKAKGKLLLARIATDQAKLERELEQTFYDTYVAAKKAGKSTKTANHMAAQKATGIIDAYWKKTLPRFGFEYVTPNKRYEYGR